MESTNYVYARLKWRRNLLGNVRWTYMVYASNFEPLVRSTEPYSSKRAAVEGIKLVLGEVEEQPGRGYIDYVALR